MRDSSPNYPLTDPDAVSETAVREDRTFLGHPVGLFILFFTEMWERFSYYGMRALLKLYLVHYLFVTSRQVLQGGGGATVAGDPDQVLGWTFIRDMIGHGSAMAPGGYASIIYGWYTGLVYLTPVIGGYIADRYWGQRKAVVVGGTLMAVGHFLMAFENWFFLALLFLILGNGAFKPNISTQVGRLYSEDDPRRDGAFTIFYMGINLGAFLCTFVCGTLASTLGWHWGFGAAGVGMLLGLGVYGMGQRFLAEDSVSPQARNQLLAAAGQRLNADEWKRVLALIGLCLLNVVFWAVYEQQGNTMQSFVDDHTAWPVLFGFAMPSTWFQSFNPLFIFLLAPLLGMFWARQARTGREPSSVAKMAIGSCILGLSFIILAYGSALVTEAEPKASWVWPVLCVLFVTVGELYLSPVGLSLVSRVAPLRMVSRMMGLWFISSFLGNVLSGYIGALYENHILDLAQFFLLLMVLGVVTGLSIWMFQRPLHRLMGDPGSGRSS
ncbi:MAG: peptide MFS transporter [Alphaproteobacteria bacterium]|nr:peptide MFS transporter [Alphaproteobacteria bacterium]